MKQWVIWTAVFGLLVTSGGGQTHNSGSAPVLAANNYFYRCFPGQWIVKYKSSSPQNLSMDQEQVDVDDVETARAAAALTLSQVTGVWLSFLREMSGGAYIFALSPELIRLQTDSTVLEPVAMALAQKCIPEEEVQRVSNQMMTLPEVEYAEPDRIFYPAKTPNDTEYGVQWHYYQTYGINAPAAWDITTGASNVVVAVVDSGVTNHTELLGRTLPGYDLISDPWIANDGGGRDNNASDPGDWVYANECFAGSPEQSSSWHGTHVAGTIGANTNNREGVAGINWVSRLLPVRVMGRCGGYLSDVVDGMRWAAGLSVPGVPVNPYPARVVNMSISGNGTCGITEQTAINAVVNSGTTVVVSAGNNSANAGLFSPASCAGVVTVAATTRDGYLAEYSNYGAYIELSAPGGLSGSANGVLSLSDSGPRYPAVDTYLYYEGTSMAAPHISGVASLLYSLVPNLTPAQVLQVMQDTASAFPSIGTCNPAICGAGIVNAGAAVSLLPRITSFSPNRADLGSSLTLKVAGANFTNGAAIYWDGIPLATTFVNVGQLTASLSPGNLTSLGAHQVKVVMVHPIYGSMTTQSKEFIVGLDKISFLPHISTNSQSFLPLSNGGFEEGISNWSYFSENGRNFAQTVLGSQAYPRSGNYASWLGGANYETSIIQQRVTFDQNFPYLTYYYWISSADECYWDFATVTVNGYFLKLHDLCFNRNTGGWVKQSLELGNYQGNTILIRFTVNNDSSYISNFYLDDISFTVNP